MRLSTSRNQTNGSTLTSLQAVMKLRSTAAVGPPLSLPTKTQLFRPARDNRIIEVAVGALGCGGEGRNRTAAPQPFQGCERLSLYY
jgi:hypothetical protein